MRHLVPLFYLLPALILLTVFTFWPIAYAIYLSTLDWNMIAPQAQPVGLGNYSELLSGREFGLALRNTATYIGIFLVVIFALPYPTAYAVTRVHHRLQELYKTTLFMPSIISLAVSSVIFLWLYNPLLGPANELLQLISVEPVNWLTDPQAVIPAMAIITAFKLFGYNFLVFLAGLVAVPRSVEEAGQLDGASAWQLFWHIYRPLTSATALYILTVTVVLGTQWSFIPIHMLTGGGPDYTSTNLVFLIYQYAFGFFLSGEAAAVAMLTLLVFLGLIILQARVLERRVYYES